MRVVFTIPSMEKNDLKIVAEETKLVAHGRRRWGPEYASSLEFGIVEDRGEDQRQEKHDGNLDRQMGDDISHRSEKHLILEKAGIILQPGEFQIVSPACLQGKKKCTDHRIEIQDEYEQCCGYDKQPAVQVDFFCQCCLCHDAFPFFGAQSCNPDTASIQRHRGGWALIPTHSSRILRSSVLSQALRRWIHPA